MNIPGPGPWPPTPIAPPVPEPDRLLTMAQVVDQVGHAESTLYRYIARGLFPKGQRRGATVRWRQSMVQAWIRDPTPWGWVRDAHGNYIPAGTGADQPVASAGGSRL